MDNLVQTDFDVDDIFQSSLLGHIVSSKRQGFLSLKGGAECNQMPQIVQKILTVGRRSDMVLELPHR